MLANIKSQLVNQKGKTNKQYYIFIFLQLSWYALHTDSDKTFHERTKHRDLTLRPNTDT